MENSNGRCERDDVLNSKFLELDFIWVNYDCLKISRCNEDNFKVGKQDITWDSDNTRGDNATWNNSKLECKGRLSFQDKKCHNILYLLSFQDKKCHNYVFVWTKASLVAYDVTELHKKSYPKAIKYEYVKGCPKWQSIQIWLLEILRIKYQGMLCT